jgi:hypothetical protein
MSEKTLRETYGHHHPDYLRGAANAFGTRPAPSKNVGLVISLVTRKRSARKRRKPLKTLVGPAGSKLQPDRYERQNKDRIR